MNKRTGQVIRSLLISYCFLLVVFQLHQTAVGQTSSGASSIVLAGSLDDRSRVLFYTEDRNVWVTYDTELGNLYRVWMGGLEDPALRSPSFLGGPPSIQGMVLFENGKEQDWHVFRKGEVITPEVSFSGYRWLGDQLVLEYVLKTSYGHHIQVEERPRISLDSEQPTLERNFSVYNTNDDIQVGLDISAEKIKQMSDLQIDGVFQRFGERKRSYYWGTAVDVEGRLLLSADTTTSISITFSPGIVANATDNTVLESSPIPRLRSIKAIESEGNQPVLQRRADHEVGISMRLYGIGEPIERLAELAPGQLPNVNQVVPQIDLTQKDQFGGLDFYFITHLSGYINIASPGEFFFRVLADDGVRLTVAGSVLLERDGLQAAQPSEDVSIALSAGVHPIEIEHFQSTGKKQLTVLWQPPWRSTFDVLGAPILSTRKEKQRFYSASRKYVKRPLSADVLQVPRIRVDAMHPSIRLEEIPLSGLSGFIGGLDVLSGGRLVVSTWKGEGRVYMLEGDLDTPSSLLLKQIASGLNKPLGIEVVDDEIFVLQQHELTQLIDNDGNELIDEYRVVSNTWEVSTDYTELAVGLEYNQGYFLSVLGMPLDREGAILIEDIHHRGVLVKIEFDGSQNIVGTGMQLSGGLLLEDGYIAISDQRNPWFSDSRVLFMPASTASIQGDERGSFKAGSIWLPVSPIQNPAQPFYLKKGSYQGDWLIGDMVNRYLYRMNVDKVNQQVQGAVFPFAADFPVSMSRLVEMPDGSFVVGASSLQESWGKVTESTSSIYRVSVEDRNAFEMKAIRAVMDGFDIEFTEQVNADLLERAGMIRMYQWPNSETRRDRTRKRGSREELMVDSIEILEDGKTARVTVNGIKAGHIIYFNVDPSVRSKEDQKLWSNEAWYSLNVLHETASTTP